MQVDTFSATVSLELLLRPQEGVKIGLADDRASKCKRLDLNPGLPGSEATYSIYYTPLPVIVYK